MPLTFSLRPPADLTVSLRIRFWGSFCGFGDGSFLPWLSYGKESVAWIITPLSDASSFKCSISLLMFWIILSVSYPVSDLIDSMKSFKGSFWLRLKSLRIVSIEVTSTFVREAIKLVRELRIWSYEDCMSLTYPWIELDVALWNWNCLSSSRLKCLRSSSSCVFTPCSSLLLRPRTAKSCFASIDLISLVSSAIDVSYSSVKWVTDSCRSWFCLPSTVDILESMFSLIFFISPYACEAWSESCVSILALSSSMLFSIFKVADVSWKFIFSIA